MATEFEVMSARNHTRSFALRGFLCGGMLLVFSFITSPPARAANSEEVALDAVAMEQLELQAANAQPREQCFLFSEVLHHLTEQAGREIAAGNEEEAEITLKHAEAVMGKMHGMAHQDTKRLKNAEMLMEHTSRRLADMMHAATDVSRGAVQSTLQKLNALHNELLAQVFAK